MKLMDNAFCHEDLLASASGCLGSPIGWGFSAHWGVECRLVREIIQRTTLSETNVSFHLRILREAGFVRAERRGAFMYYCLPDPELLSILQSLRHWLPTQSDLPSGEKNGEVELPGLAAEKPSIHSGKREAK